MANDLNSQIDSVIGEAAQIHKRLTREPVISGKTDIEFLAKDLVVLASVVKVLNEEIEILKSRK